MSKPREPRLRTAEKHPPPFSLNDFPRDFGYKLAREVVYLVATRGEAAELEGKDWERIFAACIGAEWKPSNIGLDDVVMDNCAWGAKTVKRAKPAKAKRVRLISGRNSTVFSFGEVEIRRDDPSYTGNQVLAIWNARVANLRRFHKHLRTVALLKGVGLLDLVVFEFDTVLYSVESYEWTWNRRNNLEGRERATGRHRFTWQPHGSQFTIIEEVPAKSLLISIQPPPLLNKEKVLAEIGFNKSWVNIVRRDTDS